MDHLTKHHLKRTAADYLGALINWDGGSNLLASDQCANAGDAFDHEVAKIEPDDEPEAIALLELAKLSLEENGKPAHILAFIALLDAVDAQ